MKGLFKISLIVLASSIIACGGPGQGEKPSEEPVVEVAAENLMMADYKIDGMVCAMGCAKTIEDEIGGIEGVTASSVDFESGKAHFEFDISRISENDLIAKIESLADGQYKVAVWEDEVPIEEATETNETEEANEGEIAEKVEVSFSAIEIPNLFTYLIKNL